MKNLYEHKWKTPEMQALSDVTEQLVIWLSMSHIARKREMFPNTIKAIEDANRILEREKNK